MTATKKKTCSVSSQRGLGWRGGPTSGPRMATGSCSADLPFVLGCASALPIVRNASTGPPTIRLPTVQVPQEGLQWDASKNEKQGRAEEEEVKDGEGDRR